MNELIYTWEQFFLDAERLARTIEPHRPKSLLVVTRGGIFLGGLLAEYLNIPIVETIGIRSYKERDKKEFEVLKSAVSSLPDPLIVDDIADTGETLKYLVQQYEVKSAVLFYKPKTSVIKPDFYLHETEDWVKFPWEVEL